MRTVAPLAALHQRIPEVNITPVSTPTSNLSNNLTHRSSNNNNNNINNNNHNHNSSSNHNNSNSNSNLINNNNIDIKTEERSSNLAVDDRNSTR